MKLNKRQLRRIITEEVEKLISENYAGDIQPGDYLEINV